MDQRLNRLKSYVSANDTNYLYNYASGLGVNPYAHLGAASKEGLSHAISSELHKKGYDVTVDASGKSVLAQGASCPPGSHRWGNMYGSGCTPAASDKRGHTYWQQEIKGLAGGHVSAAAAAEALSESGRVGPQYVPQAGRGRSAYFNVDQAVLDNPEAQQLARQAAAAVSGGSGVIPSFDKWVEARQQIMGARLSNGRGISAVEAGVLLEPFYPEARRRSRSRERYSAAMAPAYVPAGARSRHSGPYSVLIQRVIEDPEAQQLAAKIVQDISGGDQLLTAPQWAAALKQLSGQRLTNGAGVSAAEAAVLLKPYNAQREEERPSRYRSRSRSRSRSVSPAPMAVADEEAADSGIPLINPNTGEPEGFYQPQGHYRNYGSRRRSREYATNVPSSPEEVNINLEYPLDVVLPEMEGFDKWRNRYAQGYNPQSEDLRSENAMSYSGGFRADRTRSLNVSSSYDSAVLDKIRKAAEEGTLEKEEFPASTKLPEVPGYKVWRNGYKAGYNKFDRDMRGSAVASQVQLASQQLSGMA